MARLAKPPAHIRALEAAGLPFSKLEELRRYSAGFRVQIIYVYHRRKWCVCRIARPGEIGPCWIGLWISADALAERADNWHATLQEIQSEYPTPIEA